MSRPDPVRHPHALELLERSLAYTRGALLGVRPDHLQRPTPCARWDLDALLDHMDDALDAFAEATTGAVAPPAPRRALGARVEGLQAKACALLGCWSDPALPAVTTVAGAPLPTAHLAAAAALEIALHGWDVARATGTTRPLPQALAADLLPVARTLVDPADRPGRFAAATTPLPGDSPGRRLLAFVGRADPHGQHREQHSGAPQRYETLTIAQDDWTTRRVSR